MTLFLITARGGSKGIPGKNIKPLNGKPLICHSIDHARNFAADSDICLSTDSEEIAQVAREYGLEVPFLRPAELATDSAGSYGVILHALNFYKERGVNYDRVVLLQPTSPLRTKEDIQNALDLWRPDIDMVVSVCEAKANPYYDIFETDREGFIHVSKGDGKYTRRQDAPPVWQYNGAVYVINTESLLRGPMSGFKYIVPSVMKREHSVDLDTPLDWMLTEELMKNQ